MTEIRKDDLQGVAIAGFLQQHLDDMRSVSPPESKHALDIDALRAQDVSFWTLWEDASLAGCIALKEMDKERGEIKSMRVDSTRRGSGYGRQLLQHVIDEARCRGYTEIMLETGSMEFFAPARQLYARFGFQACAPFGKYVEDPNSVFMKLDMAKAAAGKMRQG
ncbi:MAG: GNAT family N-acetyltransferase [Proteobacteria bacterium]|nr:GNAT family N-acetyltransferase [Pseudomonadota bacterium]